MPERPLGTMITYGYPEIELDDELNLATADWRLGAGDPSGVESACPIRHWSAGDRPIVVCRFIVHTAAGAGERSGRGESTWDRSTPSTHRESIDDLKALRGLAGGSGGQVPGCPSRRLVARRRNAPERRAALASGLWELAEHARGTRCDRLCREHAARRSSRQPHGRAGRACCASSTILSSRLRSIPAMPT